MKHSLDLSSDSPHKIPRLSLTSQQKEIIQDSARVLDLFELLNKYQDLGLHTLFDAFDAPFPGSDTSMAVLLPLLHQAIQKKIQKRKRRSDLYSLEHVLELLEKSQHIIVLTGAGVSVSCGIPDFRSKNGIYARLDEFNLSDPQEMFDLSYFKINPSTFYTFAKEIYPSHFTPSPSHMFIKLLQDKGKLLRNYTQNIDTLEQKAGISNIIQCHGSFAFAKCIECGYTVPGSEIEQDIFNQTVPKCPQCPEEVDGILKPSITFFGESLPDAFDRAFDEDRNKVDLLIVMGSSLKVSPVADVKDKIPHDVPQILINMESLPHMNGFDIQLLGKCDLIVTELCRLLQWDLRHEQIPGGSSLAPRSEEPPIHAGSEPHKYLFEGGVEKFVYLSSSEEEDDESVNSFVDSVDEESNDAEDEEIMITEDHEQEQKVNALTQEILHESLVELAQESLVAE